MVTAIIPVMMYLLSLLLLLRILRQIYTVKDFTHLNSFLNSLRFTDKLPRSVEDVDAEFILTSLRKARQLGIRSREAFFELCFLMQSASEDAKIKTYHFDLFAARALLLASFACTGRLVFAGFFGIRQNSDLALIDFFGQVLALISVLSSFIILNRLLPTCWVGENQLSSEAKSWFYERLFLKGGLPNQWGAELANIRNQELKIGRSLRQEKENLLKLFLKTKKSEDLRAQKQLADALILFELGAQSLPLICLALGPVCQLLNPV